MPDDKLEIIRAQFIQGQAQPGSILAKVLEGLPAEDVQRLKHKAAEGMLGAELQKMAMSNRFQASSVDIDEFIQTVVKLERSAGRYEAKTRVETASGETTIQVKKGCYIATAVYEGYNHPNVAVLRNFRDTLEQYGPGRFACSIYYRYSPALAKSVFSSGYPKRAMWRILDAICNRIRN